MEIHELNPLFKDVQMTSVFPDSKTFPDCQPKRSLVEIDQDYQAQNNKTDFDLAEFVAQNFQAPKAYSANFNSDHNKSAREHIENLWPLLTRQPADEKSSLITLPFQYIVPGGRFGEIYYWDSYFTMLGLRVSGRINLIQNMVDNFSDLINRFGYIPNGNRTYYLGRSQPPFFSLMVKLLSEEKGDLLLVNYLSALEKEYHFWMKGEDKLTSNNIAIGRVVRLADGSVLNRYWDEHDTPRPEAYKEDVELSQHSSRPGDMFRHIRAAAESGWDFSSRWFKNPNAFETIHTTEIIPVDLNCLLMYQEELLAATHHLAGNKEKGLGYEDLAAKRKSAIQKYCWNEKGKFYFDYDFINQKTTDRYTLAGAFPLFFKVASAKQAAEVCNQIENKFLKPGGLTTTLEKNGQQWDAPNGWAPLQWITFQGCKNYSQLILAAKVKEAWLRTNNQVYINTGKMMEKYDVYGGGDLAGGGEYPNQDGFGWTNGVYLAMMESADSDL